MDTVLFVPRTLLKPTPKPKRQRLWPRLLLAFGAMVFAAFVIWIALVIAPKVHLPGGGVWGESISAAVAFVALVFVAVLALMWLALPLIVYFGFKRVEERLDRLTSRLGS